MIKNFEQLKVRRSCFKQRGKTAFAREYLVYNQPGESACWDDFENRLPSGFTIYLVNLLCLLA